MVNESDIKAVAEKIAKVINAYKVILFGSHARGQARPEARASRWVRSRALLALARRRREECRGVPGAAASFAGASPYPCVSCRGRWLPLESTV